MSQETWIEGYRDIRAKIVAQETVVGVFVSTVHLGLNHSFHEHMAPLIFETMTFPDKDEESLGHDSGQWRWATEANAIKGHQAVVAWLLKEGPEPTDDSGMTRKEWDGERQGQEGRVAVGIDDE